MRYKSLKQCIDDLDRNHHLIRITQEVDPHLEMAEIHRRVYQANGPAIYYAHVKGSPFPAVSNLFGTLDRSRFIFRSMRHWHTYAEHWTVTFDREYPGVWLAFADQAGLNR